MPGLQTFLSAYLCTLRVCAKDKILTKNCQIKTIQTDRLTGQRQNIGEKKNKTIRRKAWKKLQVEINRRND